MRQIPAGDWHEILELVDLERYPVDKLDSDTGQVFLRQCQQQMNNHGWCSLDGFIRPEAIEMLVTEVTTL